MCISLRKNWFPVIITSSCEDHEDKFHTVYARSTAKGPSCGNNHWAVTQSWTRFCFMKRKCFCRTREAAIVARWLYMIWYITGMRASFHDLSDSWKSERYQWSQLCLTLTRIFNEGSASARRPAVTQAVAPPDLIVSMTTTQIFKAPYLLRRWYHKLYHYCLLRTLLVKLKRMREQKVFISSPKRY